MVMSPFRRGIRADTKKTGGKGGNRRFHEQLRLPVDVATAFAIIEARYVDPNPAQEEITPDPATGRPMEVVKSYFKARMHKRALPSKYAGGNPRYVNSVCAAGWNPHAPQPCAGCSAMDQGDKSMGIGDVAVFGVVHLATYHRHPIVDQKTGGYVVKQNPKPGETNLMLVDDECEGRTCNYCRILQGHAPIQDPQARQPFPNYRPTDIQTFFGKRRYMELGKNHLQNLGGWDSTISSLCANDGSQLITDGFKCPTCGTLVIDMNNPQETRNDTQIQEAVAQPQPCMRCQRPVLLEEVVACEVCEQNNRPPRQWKLHERVLWGMRQGEKTSSQLVLHRHESFEEFFARVPPQLLGGKTWQQLMTDLAKPYEFAKMYEPKAIGEQMKELELQGMQGPVPGTMPGYGAPAMGPGPSGTPGQYMQPNQPASGPMPTGYGAPPPQGVAPGYPPAPAGGPAPAGPGPAAPGPMPHGDYRR